MQRYLLLILGLSCVPLLVLAIDNGKGITPPMGWRSWNLFGANVDQTLMEKQMDGLVSRSRLVDGVPTSLADLGYNDIGLDDNWQQCGSYGPQGFTYHDAKGVPQVNTVRFPNFNQMTSYGHSLGLTVGWYGNNCICQDHCTDIACYRGDVFATIQYGFDSIKLDNCGQETDLSMYALLFNSTGKSILIENCHWGRTLPTATECPYNYYRTSGDIRANYSAVIRNLMTTVPLAKKGLSRPGCWAYPDMLEVGCAAGPGGSLDVGLSFTESRTHFGAWCIVSSPLILSHDTNNDTISDAIWPIISNKEAIQINQAWAGDSGSLYATVPTGVDVLQCIRSSDQCYQLWSKLLDSTKLTTAVMVINHSLKPSSTIVLDFTSIPSFISLPPFTTYSVRDVWSHTDMGTFSQTISISPLSSHDSALLIITPVGSS